MATNIGLRRAYTVWAFFYDSAVRCLRWSRRRSLALLDFRTRDTVLLVGCRMANALLGGYVAAVDRNFHAILKRTSLKLLREIPLAFGGLYLIYLLRKPGTGTDAPGPSEEE